LTETGIRYQKVSPDLRPRTEPQLREEIIQVCHLMWQKGYVAATDGNVSARLGKDRFLCTPSGFSKGLIRAEQLVVVDWEANPVGPAYGATRDLLPSSEMLTHLEAYRLRPDVQAVVHAHPPIAVALSIAGISLARCLLPEVVLAFCMIPTAKYSTPSSAEGAEVIRELITRYDARQPDRRHHRRGRLPEAGEAGGHRPDHQNPGGARQGPPAAPRGGSQARGLAPGPGPHETRSDRRSVHRVRRLHATAHQAGVGS